MYFASFLIVSLFVVFISNVKAVPLNTVSLLTSLRSTNRNSCNFGGFTKLITSSPWWINYKIKEKCFELELEFYGAINTTCIKVISNWQVYLTTYFLGRLSPLSYLPVLVHILSPETDNCPSWISKRERMIVENISRSISMKECCWTDRHQPMTS